MAEVRDLMSRDVVTVSPDLSLRDTVGLLDDRHITGAPVVSNGQVVGVISVSDLMSFEAATPGIPRDRPRQQEWELKAPSEWEEGSDAPGTYFSEWWQDAGADLVERFQEVSSPEWDVLVEHTVSEAMNRSVCSIGPDADAAEAAAYMLRAGVHRLLVTDESELVGIITTTDIVRAVAEQRL
jgi:predicted transcriptional regulator